MGEAAHDSALLQCYIYPATYSNITAEVSLNISLILQSNFLLKQLTGYQVFKKSPSLCNNRAHITPFTSAHHLSASWARPIQCMPPNPTTWRSILILSSYLLLGLPSGLFPACLPHQNSVQTSSIPHTCYLPHSSD